MAYEPEFTGESVAPSSADASYHPVAIQLYGHASKFNGTTTNHVRGDLQMYWSLLHIFASKTSLSELGTGKRKPDRSLDHAAYANLSFANNACLDELACRIP